MAQPVVGKEGYYVMKKVYIVRLENDKGEIAFHVRMKGIPTSVIVNRANELYPDSTPCHVDGGLVKPDSPVGPFSIMLLYKALYDGETIEFDLVKGSRPCFDIQFGEVHTRASFIRRIGLKV